MVKESLVITCGRKRGALYMVQQPCNRVIVAIDGGSTYTQWLQRLTYAGEGYERHMQEKGMKVLVSNEKILKR